jgi:hypothetical protein
MSHFKLPHAAGLCARPLWRTPCDMDELHGFRDRRGFWSLKTHPCLRLMYKGSNWDTVKQPVSVSMRKNLPWVREALQQMMRDSMIRRKLRYGINKDTCPGLISGLWMYYERAGFKYHLSDTSCNWLSNPKNWRRQTPSPSDLTIMKPCVLALITLPICHPHVLSACQIMDQNWLSRPTEPLFEGKGNCHWGSLYAVISPHLYDWQANVPDRGAPLTLPYILILRMIKDYVLASIKSFIPEGYIPCLLVRRRYFSEREDLATMRAQQDK